MNRDEYRRAIIMLRSTRSGLSGYVRLERRTLMGTLQFTVNGADGKDSELHALLICRKEGSWHAVRLGELSAPRYGQAGLMWKFDPRSIEGRTLEQYALAAVVERRAGICDLVLCGNLNGSVAVDWAQVRDAACRLFTPVRISGAPIAPIASADEAANCAQPESAAQTPAEDAAPSAALSPAEEPVPPAEQTSPEETAPSIADAAAGKTMPPEETDSVLESKEQTKVSINSEQTMPAVDEFDMPAGASSEPTAGQQLALEQPDAPWPESIEPLRALFFSEPAITPFDAAGYVFVRAPLPEGSGTDYCVVGIHCSAGRPDSVMYAIPSSHTPEPPAGLEGYIWQNGVDQGYWTICENISE